MGGLRPRDVLGRADDLPSCSRTQPKIKIVLRNLVGNAVKFTARLGDDRGAACGRRRRGRRERHRNRHSGGQRDAIFAPFFQLDGSSRAATGSRSRPAHRQALLSLLGGTVSVESDVGPGPRSASGCRCSRWWTRRPAGRLRRLRRAVGTQSSITHPLGWDLPRRPPPQYQAAGSAAGTFLPGRACGPRLRRREGGRRRAPRRGRERPEFPLVARGDAQPGRWALFSRGCSNACGSWEGFGGTAQRPTEPEAPARRLRPRAGVRGAACAAAERCRGGRGGGA